MAKPPEKTLARALNEQTIQHVLENHLTGRKLSSCQLVCQDLAARLAQLLFADITVLSEVVHLRDHPAGQHSSTLHDISAQ